MQAHRHYLLLIYNYNLFAAFACNYIEKKMMTDQMKEEDNMVPLSEKFTAVPLKSSKVKISHKYTLGNIDKATFCVRYDPNDKYIAQGCSDGSIRIYNVFSGK